MKRKTMNKNKTGIGEGKTGVASPARRFERKQLAVVMIALGVLGLVALGAAVVAGGTGEFDQGLLLALREHGDLANPLGPRWLEETVRDVSALGSTFVLTFAVVVVAGFLWIVDAPLKAAFLVAAVSLGSLLNRLLKLAVARPRPDIVEHATYVSNESFPSGHTANSAIVYLVLGMMLARVEDSFAAKIFVFGVCTLLTVMIGLSRVYLGVHWPTDVLAGWILGGSWAVLCWYVLVSMQPSGTRR
jgi:undecaprenyl-diphosphatase